MRQKLCKEIRRKAYGEIASNANARRYSWVPNKNGMQTLVADNTRAYYQRAKKGIYARMHPKEKKSEALRNSRHSRRRRSRRNRRNRAVSTG